MNYPTQNSTSRKQSLLFRFLVDANPYKSSSHAKVYHSATRCFSLDGADCQTVKMCSTRIGSSQVDQKPATTLQMTALDIKKTVLVKLHYNYHSIWFQGVSTDLLHDSFSSLIWFGSPLGLAKQNGADLHSNWLQVRLVDHCTLSSIGLQVNIPIGCFLRWKVCNSKPLAFQSRFNYYIPPMALFLKLEMKKKQSNLCL